MQTVRDVALELGVSSHEILDRLDRMGAPAAGELSPVESDLAAELRAEFNGTSRTSPMPPIPSSNDGGHTAPSSDRATAVTTRGEAPPPPPPSSEQAAHAEPYRRRSSAVAQLAELPMLILLAFVIAVVIKTFLVQAFFIPSTSMLPTLRKGDRVLVEKVSYRFREPRAKDVVVFARSAFGGAEPDLPWYQDARNFLRELLGLPTGIETDYIKRIVAVGGDTIIYTGNPRRLTVNGEVISEPYIRGGRDSSSPTITKGNCVDMQSSGDGCLVPEGRVFVMGDNRGSSEDSRIIGPVPEDKVIGRAFVVIWPLDDLSGL